MWLHILFTVTYVVLLTALIARLRFFNIPGIPQRWIQGLFWLKILVGLGLWAIYTWHYTYRDTSDAFRYFDDAMVIYRTGDPLIFFKFLFGIGLDSEEFIPLFEQMHGWSSSYSYGIINDNPFIIRVNMLLSLLSHGYYHVHTVFMAFLSTVGGVALLKMFRQWRAVPVRWLVLVCFLIPSLLFWSSGVLKEAPLLAVLGLTCYQLSMWYHRNQSWRLALIAVGVFTLFFIKGYVVLAFIPAVISLMVMRLVAGRKWVVAAVVHVVLLIFALNSSVILPQGDLAYVLSKKQVDFYNVAEAQEAGSTIAIPSIGSSADLLLQSPGAIYRTYFRPDWRDLKGLFQWFLAGENLVLTMLIVLCLLFFKKPDVSALPIVLFSLSVVLTLGLIIGSTVPILGAVVRYKIPALPFLGFLLLTFTDLAAIKSHWRALFQKNN